MSDDDSKKPELTSGDLPGLSSHFSTTLTGLAPLRRKRRATTSGEVPPEEDGENTATDGDEAPPEPRGAADPEPLTEVHDGPELAPLEPPESASDSQAPPESGEPEGTGSSDLEDSPAANPAVVHPLEGIELRPGLSLVDTAEIPIHRAQAAAKLRAGKPVEPTPQKPPPPRPQPPVIHRHSADDEPSTARLTPHRRSSGLGWIYLAVILLIAALIGALLFQVADLM